MDPIRTPRLTIRRPSKTDLNPFLAYRNDPENLKHQPIQPMSEASAIEFLDEQHRLDPRSAFGWIMFAVELTREDRMIGEVGIYIPTDGDQGDVGWSFLSTYQRQGFATEASQELLKFAFEQRQLPRVTANCDPQNSASIKLMARLGMRQTTLKRQSPTTFAMVREEWIRISSDLNLLRG